MVGRSGGGLAFTPAYQRLDQAIVCIASIFGNTWALEPDILHAASAADDFESDVVWLVDHKVKE